MYLSEAVSAVSSTLAQADSRDIPDGTIAAVACLANMEVWELETKNEYINNGIELSFKSQLYAQTI
jgi:predicted nucleic acid-binding protein